MVTAGILPFRETSHGRAGNRARDLMISSQRLWPLDHEAGHFLEVRRLQIHNGEATNLAKSFIFTPDMQYLIVHEWDTGLLSHRDSPNSVRRCDTQIYVSDVTKFCAASLRRKCVLFSSFSLYLVPSSSALSPRFVTLNETLKKILLTSPSTWFCSLYSQ